MTICFLSREDIYHYYYYYYYHYYHPHHHHPHHHYGLKSCAKTIIIIIIASRDVSRLYVLSFEVSTLNSAHCEHGPEVRG